MKPQPYSPQENALIAEQYVKLAVAQFTGAKLVKSDVVKALIPQLNNRSRGSIESKFMNFSAKAVEFNLLPGLPFGYVKGYKPASKAQKGIEQYLILALARELWDGTHIAAGVVENV